MDDILKVDGLDVFSVGMRDLSTSLGYQGDWNHPNVQKIVEEVVEKVMAAGRQYWQSGSSDAELAVRTRRYEQGVRYFTVGALDLVSRSAGRSSQVPGGGKLTGLARNLIPVDWC